MLNLVGPFEVEIECSNYGYITDATGEKVCEITSYEDELTDDEHLKLEYVKEALNLFSEQ